MDSNIPTKPSYGVLFLNLLDIYDGICENQPHCTCYQNEGSAMNNVIDVWSRSGENLEAIACIFLDIQSLEARRVG